MKILIVSWFFPPSNTIGALRVGKMARYLRSEGHSVRVLTARDPPYAQNMPLGIPEQQVVRSRWIDVNAPPKGAVKLRRKLRDAFRGGAARTAGRVPEPPGSVPPAEVGRRKGALGRFATALGELYTDVLNYPDAYVGWIPFALCAGRGMIARERPDIIFATGPMFSALVIGHILAKRYGIPWVAELRDRWSDDPYYPPVAWRARLMRMLERKLLSGASGIGTVSNPWAENFVAAYGKPTIVMFNGYDPEDMSAPGVGSTDTAKLRIVHTGHIYAGRRDPTPLFKALSLLGEEAGNIALSFPGAREVDIRPLAEAHGVAHVLEPFRRLPHAEALAEQARADILLLMQWNDPREQGNVPGKLFEYLAARRPILGLGLETGVPATIIRQQGAGSYINDPEAIAAQLREWLRLKRETGAIAILPESVREGFTRDRQFAKLPPFLIGLLDSQES